MRRHLGWSGPPPHVIAIRQRAFVFAILVQQDVHHVDVFLARDADDVVYILFFKALDEELGGVLGLRPFGSLPAKS